MFSKKIGLQKFKGSNVNNQTKNKTKFIDKWLKIIKN